MKKPRRLWRPGRGDFKQCSEVIVMQTAHVRNQQHPLFESPVVAGPWPSYAQYRDLPERDRWAMYDFAKQQREDMQAAGFQFSETYDPFVRRVTDELEL